MLKVIELNDTGNKGVTELRAKFLWQNGAYKISHVPLNAKFPPVVKSFTDKEVWSSQPDTKTLVKEVGGLSKRNWSLFLNVSDLVCIDVDIEGMEWYNSLSPLQSDELKATLSAMTPSGGFHFIFKSKENVTYSQFTKGVDIKHKGYILIEPSVLPNGKYQWTNETEPKDMPEWLEKLCCKSKVEKLREPIPETILDEVQKSLIDDVDWDKLVEEVKPHTFDYNEFFKIGMSLHYIFSGSPFGLDLWKRLSHNASYVDGDEGRCEDKWRGYNNEKDLKVGLKTFLNIMSRKGLVPCHKETKEPVFEKYVFETDKEVVDKINEMGYYYVDQQKVICQYDGEYVKGMNVPQFNLSVAPIQKLQKSPNGKLSLVAGSSIWVKSPKRNSVGNITFTPNPRPIDLNTWPTEPFLPPPKTTVNIEFFKQFVFEVICKNDKQKYEWIMRRDAFMYQHLGRKDQTVLFLFGDEGIGKGTYTDSIHGRILGKYFTRTRKERIDDRFNEDQSRKFYTVFDEAGFLKSDKLVDIVKERTGSNTMTVESKFGAVYSIENYSRYTVTTNNRTPVRLSKSNRRFLVWEVSNKWKGEKLNKFFHWLHENDVIETIYQFYLGLDIKDFNPQLFPEHLNADSKETRVEQLNPISKATWDIMFESPEKLWVKHAGGVALNKRLTYEMTMRRLKSSGYNYPVSETTFWRTLYKELEINPRCMQIGTSERYRALLITPLEMATALIKATQHEESLLDEFDETEFIYNEY